MWNCASLHPEQVQQTAISEKQLLHAVSFPADGAVLPSQGMQDQSDAMLRRRMCGDCKLHGNTYWQDKPADKLTC